jgi:lipocalin
MNLETQFKLINNSSLQQYLRKNSHWYKILNRNPEMFNSMLQEMKDKYRMNTTDRIEDFVSKLQMIQSVMGAFK